MYRVRVFERFSADEFKVLKFLSLSHENDGHPSCNFNLGLFAFFLLGIEHLEGNVTKKDSR